MHAFISIAASAEHFHDVFFAIRRARPRPVEVVRSVARYASYGQTCENGRLREKVNLASGVQESAAVIATTVVLNGYSGT